MSTKCVLHGCRQNAVHGSYNMCEFCYQREASAFKCQTQDCGCFASFKVVNGHTVHNKHCTPECPKGQKPSEERVCKCGGSVWVNSFTRVSSKKCTDCYNRAQDTRDYKHTLETRSCGDCLQMFRVTKRGGNHTRCRGCRDAHNNRREALAFTTETHGQPGFPCVNPHCSNRLVVRCEACCEQCEEVAHQAALSMSMARKTCERYGC